MKHTIYVSIEKIKGMIDKMLITDAIEKSLSNYQVVFDNNVSEKFDKINAIRVDTASLDFELSTKVMKILKELSTEMDIVIITAGPMDVGITPVSFDNSIMTEQLKDYLCRRSSIVKTIEMTCSACPEQYDCYDKYGNQVAYLRLRHGVFSVECPDAFYGTTVYENWEDIHGDGVFDSTSERISQLECAFTAIDNYYNIYMRTIKRIRVDGVGYKFEKIDPEDDDQELLETLYKYESSNFTPDDVINIRKKGPTIGYKEAILKIIRAHRLQRGNMFPEANGRDGLNPDHVERELEFFKTTVDGLGGNLKTVNWLFDKKFEDFETIFRYYADMGYNAL